MSKSRCHIYISEAISPVNEMPLEALNQLATTAVQVMDTLNCEPDTEMSIQIAADEFVRQLNHTYRGVDAPTDVLSFPGETLPPEIEETPYLGDLVLGYHYTLEAAARAGHQQADEFGLLVVHGILHLMGYDHDTQESQAEMWARQAELLQMLSIPIVVPDFVHDDQGV